MILVCHFFKGLYRSLTLFFANSSGTTSVSCLRGGGGRCASSVGFSPSVLNQQKQLSPPGLRGSGISLSSYICVCDLSKICFSVVGKVCPLVIAVGSSVVDKVCFPVIGKICPLVIREVGSSVVDKVCFLAGGKIRWSMVGAVSS